MHRPTCRPARPFLRSDPDERAACVRRLRELRIIRDRDIPELLHDARSLALSDDSEEIVQLACDLAFVEARIAELESLLRPTIT